jgi:hypothetical protein
LRRKIELSNYWIFKVKDDKNSKYSLTGKEIYDHRMKNDYFWGLKEFTKEGKKTRNVAHLRAGDFVLCYLVGGYCFLGECILSSGFRSLTPEESKKITHPEFLDLEQGVFLNKESIDPWSKTLPIKSLTGKVHFAPIGKNYGSYIQGSITRIKNKQDYDAVIHEHELMR